MIESSLCKALGFKHNRGGKNSKKGIENDPSQKKSNVNKHPRGKGAGKKDSTK